MPPWLPARPPVPTACVADNRVAYRAAYREAYNCSHKACLLLQLVWLTAGLPVGQLLVAACLAACGPAWTCSR